MMGIRRSVRDRDTWIKKTSLMNSKLQRNRCHRPSDSTNIQNSCQVILLLYLTEVPQLIYDTLKPWFLSSRATNVYMFTLKPMTVISLILTDTHTHLHRWSVFVHKHLRTSIIVQNRQLGSKGTPVTIFIIFLWLRISDSLCDCCGWEYSYIVVVIIVSNGRRKWTEVIVVGKRN